MQFFWKYIDDLMGKGLDTFVLIELIFWTTLSIFPLAIPLSVLLSSIMTMGNLAENNELTALKSAGLSLYRIMRPLFVVMVFLSVVTFYFSNYALTIAELKWRWIIYDIQQQKPTFVLNEGKFYYDFDGYAIKAEKIDKEKSLLEDIVIYDHAVPRNIKVIKAVSGKMYNSDDEKYLYLDLYDGRMYEGVTPSNPNGSRFLPFQKSKFSEATFRFDLSGFSINRSNQEMFKNNVEMLNVFQLQGALDSVAVINEEIRTNFAQNIKNQHGYFQSKTYVHGKSPKIIDKTKVNNQQSNQIINKETVANKQKVKEPENEVSDNDKSAKTKLDTLSTMVLNSEKWPKQDLNKAIQTSSIKLRNRKDELNQYIQILNSRKQQVAKYKYHWHNKFTLSVSILILFCIGAPLGAIIRKGGLGMPVVVSVFLFIVYYVLIETGKKMAMSGVLEPWIGAWLSTFILAPVAVFIMYKAANDSKIFNKETFTKYLSFKRLFKRVNLPKK